MNPDKQTHHYVDFLDFLVTRDHISFWCYMQRTLPCILNIVYALHIQLYFSELSAFLLLKILNFLFWICTLTRAILKCAKTMYTVPQHCQQQLMSCLYCVFVCLAIFSLITIFGNAHRPCEQYLSIVDNRLHYIYTVFLLLWLYFH